MTQLQGANDIHKCWGMEPHKPHPVDLHDCPTDLIQQLTLAVESGGNPEPSP